MPKIADKYLAVDPWKIIEEGFDPERNRVSESIFSLGNEYMGVRGYVEEGYSGDTLLGSYFNGLFEESEVGAHYKGIIRSLRFMVNGVDWLYTRITIDDETFDMGTAAFSDFRRELDFKRGIYSRQLVWHLRNGKSVQLTFERLISMRVSNLGCQRIVLKPLNFSGAARIIAGLDFSTIHEDRNFRYWESVKQGSKQGISAMLGQTANTRNRLFSSYRLDLPKTAESVPVSEYNFTGHDILLELKKGEPAVLDKLVINVANKEPERSHEDVWDEGMKLAERYAGVNYESAAEEQERYWAQVWEHSDIVIDGDPDNQQGIRFCIFQLYQTYHGDNPGFNIGAKGLTGEAYRGLAFWDTESYCLPFYIFNNPKAARSLLEFRYKTLPHALERAKELDCEGAFYPIATIDGTESCDLWQHSNLQLHVGTAVAYGLRHYVNMTGDKAFLYEKGLEMLIQISRFYASRGQWGQKSGKYGYFGVMGPDEFQLMVNNNCYINLMAKKMFEFTLQTIAEMEEADRPAFAGLSDRLGLTVQERLDWKNKADNMKIPYDEETGIYEEHDGFFDMPHLDIHSIPVTEFPLYSHWSYDRLYRYDMIKQPDVLMFMFLYSGEFSLEAKRANYDYYEARCIHESSLSPSIHSILAAEIGRQEEAYKFFEFATRLDLDNYNRNTREGLHTTSIAAAWMNIVYGFGGMRSDGDKLLFNPSIPERWNQYSFPITYGGTQLAVEVDRQQVKISVRSGDPVEINVYGQDYIVGPAGIELSLEKVG
ncbi:MULTISPECIES: glycoside hydrolase family 65 protein [unclassified Paenibacillus]|uniref:glycoside hydrolase family 65 protein n=1 Tax=unclassified Paenibacillus TaxID=185978 RepID=UPI001C103FAC|nr:MULTISPECIES: glycosyl hydrolase family 65 protein [unclassified Paenibacillus]MBU5444558.1 family 65 glycosyl hydrolase [Paenibacillus sp. MSJ-34]CAH0120220.1 Maltose phosphorylase [Paenibacillus sp. CECT 9249]